jgi:hypothetical protein
MHIKFDINKIKFTNIKLKSINPMTGYIGYIDESITDKEKIKRVDCPKSILRTFKNIYKSTTYVVPQDACILTYDNHVIALEKLSLGKTEYQMKSILTKVIGLLNTNYEWYFDGSYIYSFFGSQDNAILKGSTLTDDGKFRVIKTKAVFINYIGFSDDVYVEDRECLGYYSNDQYSISPPVWKMLDNVGENKLKDKDDSNLVMDSQFDKIDSKMLVNLQFAIMAGNVLSKQFGYHIIEPLQLPRLMIQLKTVNLQAVPIGTKQTFDIGFTFSQAMAWLLGIYKNKVNSYEDMIAMKKLFRYLSANGIYSKSAMKNIYARQDHNVPSLSINELMLKMELKG